MPNARTATARDFEASAYHYARAFWFWAVAGGIVALLWGWWSVPLFLMALLSVVKSVGGGHAAQQLRKGTYPIPNPNNGAPDGDASKLGAP